MGGLVYRVAAMHVLQNMQHQRKIPTYIQLVMMEAGSEVEPPSGAPYPRAAQIGRGVDWSMSRSLQ